MKILYRADARDSPFTELALVPAKSATAWLLSLRTALSELEEDTDEAWQKRQELVTQLVERITVSCAEDGRPKAHIAYRFAPPVQVASSVMNVLWFVTPYDTSPLTLVATVVK